MGIMETILTISGVIVAVGGAAVYIAKAIGAAMKPTNRIRVRRAERQKVHRIAGGRHGNYGNNTNN